MSTERETFAFWKDAKIDGHVSGKTFAQIGVCAGLVVDDRGVRVCVEGDRGTFSWAYLDSKQERALYEALRVRFDTEHRAAVEQEALAKLSATEREVLREKWSK